MYKKNGKMSLKFCIIIESNSQKSFFAIVLGPVVQRPVNAKPRLKVNQGVYFSTPRRCSTLIFGKTLH